MTIYTNWVAERVTKSQNIQSIQTENFFRSNRSHVYYKKSVQKNFTKFIEKVCVEVFLDKAAGWRTEFLSKKTPAWLFSGNLLKFLRTAFIKQFSVTASNFPKSDAESFA